MWLSRTYDQAFNFAFCFFDKMLKRKIRWYPDDAKGYCIVERSVLEIFAESKLASNPPDKDLRSTLVCTRYQEECVP
jgi:hypothetical protein